MCRLKCATQALDPSIFDYANDGKQVVPTSAHLHAPPEGMSVSEKSLPEFVNDHRYPFRFPIVVVGNPSALNEFRVQGTKTVRAHDAQGHGNRPQRSCDTSLRACTALRDGHVDGAESFKSTRTTEAGHIEQSGDARPCDELEKL